MIIYILVCPDACKCLQDGGNGHNGGKSLNLDGYCEFVCSAVTDGVRYCGDGYSYRLGDFVDCTSCKGAY